VLRHVTVLKLAEEEAEAIGDLDALGVAEIVVTAGTNGSRVITRDGDVHVPARFVAADPTGAGDAFAIGYLGSRADGHSPLSAARRATALVAALMAGGAR
jgi:sugar/nucleoside kinase (ribokinase family)